MGAVIRNTDITKLHAACWGRTGGERGVLAKKEREGVLPGTCDP